MCGICGLIGNTMEREQVLERMMRVIRYRGPDGSGAYFPDSPFRGFSG
ncbi:MAG: hypothetical protein K2O16_15535 [Lachnospiraceae bacterium]|nr:hypothetical protein [Lachnospiraceae bacterium]